MQKKCDLILKGGIASGVVYPKAITELATKYDFVNLGGTSAGAIAAGFTAAAQYNRSKNGVDDGFSLLDELPDTLGENLFNLFQPEKAHRKLFHAIVKKIEGGKIGTGSNVWFVVRHFLSIRRSVNALPDTYYGMCNGMTKEESLHAGLTPWLHQWLEKAAGRIDENGGFKDKPLTFGMLAEQGVKLRTISTNVSQHTPVTLPNIGSARMKYSDAVNLLPPNVVDYLDNTLDGREGDNGEYLRIPSGDDLPVIIGVRMSLSFPVLLSAFPIYKYDNTLRGDLPTCKEDVKEPKICWFSDGGITSNFPVHLFDSIFPSRPTFGIALHDFNECRQAPDQGKPGKNRVYLPVGARQRQKLGINKITGLGNFLMSIFTSAQVWQDENQTILSGYRERIVNLYLKPDEGGLNIKMTSAQIHSLVTIGQLAGQEITNTFSFDEHRWRRILSSYAALEKVLEELSESFFAGQPESTQDFLTRYQAGLMSGELIASSYKPRQRDFEELQARITDLMELARSWEQSKLRKNWGANDRTMPKPSSELKIVPEMQP